MNTQTFDFNNLDTLDAESGKLRRQITKRLLLLVQDKLNTNQQFDMRNVLITIDDKNKPPKVEFLDTNYKGKSIFTSPEERLGKQKTNASTIYAVGVFLQLLWKHDKEFESKKDIITKMTDENPTKRSKLLEVFKSFNIEPTPLAHRKETTEGILSNRISDAKTIDDCINILNLMKKEHLYLKQEQGGFRFLQSVGTTATWGRLIDKLQARAYELAKYDKNIDAAKYNSILNEKSGRFRNVNDYKKQFEELVRGNTYSSKINR